ncbi:MAG: hypothetical protein ABIA47_02320 [bacterium]
MQSTAKITDREARAVCLRQHMIAELVRRKTIPLDVYKRVTGELLAEYAPEVLEAERPEQKRNLAEERRMWLQDWYHALGFMDVEAPLPTVDGKPISNRELKYRRKGGEELFYRSGQISYAAFMKAVGQEGHWTLEDEEQDKIGWEPTETGYWFWAEVAERCPRTGTSWNTLSASITLLSLEEYAVIWHAYKAATDIMLDVPAYCWLRTRHDRGDGFDSGALHAFERGVGVGVDAGGPEYLSADCSVGGGRAVEKLAA